MTTLFMTAGPFIALLLAAALATRALVLAGNPGIRFQSRRWDAALAVLAVLFVLSIALRLLEGV
jgi:hypothetical protein